MRRASEHGVARVKALHPHLALRSLGGHVGRVAPGPARRLHEQGQQALGRPKIAGEQGAVGLHRRHQGDAPKVVALGDHLRAHQHIDLARVHLGQLALQRPLARVLSASMRATRTGCRPALHAVQQGGQLFFELLGAPAQGRRCRAAAARAGARYAHAKPQWWQRRLRSILWNTWCALQCGQSLFQPQSWQCSTGA